MMDREGVSSLPMISLAKFSEVLAIGEIGT
jgi:hypothetical protein